jgi:hypothetical protein
MALQLALPQPPGSYPTADAAATELAEMTQQLVGSGDKMIWLDVVKDGEFGWWDVTKVALWLDENNLYPGEVWWVIAYLFRVNLGSVQRHRATRAVDGEGPRHEFMEARQVLANVKPPPDSLLPVQPKSVQQAGVVAELLDQTFDFQATLTARSAGGNAMAAEAVALCKKGYPCSPNTPQVPALPFPALCSVTFPHFPPPRRPSRTTRSRTTRTAR